jgi:hypothetical protein
MEKGKGRQGKYQKYERAEGRKDRKVGHTCRKA